MFSDKARNISNENEQLTDQNIPCWKPFTLRIPYLALLISLTIFFIVAIEVLLGKTLRDGAVTFADGEELNGWQVFLSQYAGTVASVIFAIMLSFSDLDAKRLEPWFEMSKPNGANAKNSLLLCYPFDFLAFVPFKAAKRGHWSIFHVGTATVLVFWAITPLQSSLIASIQKTREIVAPITINQKLQLVTEYQSDSASFLNIAYGMTWLNSSAPKFSTRNVTMLAFGPTDNSETRINETWTGKTSAYYSEAHCTEAKHTIFDSGVPSLNGNNDTRYIFTDQATNCSFEHSGFPNVRRIGEENFPEWRPYYGQFIGYNAGQNSQYSLKTSTCLFQEDPHMFLLIFSRLVSPNSTKEVNAIYCRLKYFTHTVDLTIDAQSKEVKEITNFGVPRELTADELNPTLMEDMISGGATPGPEGPFSQSPSHLTRAREISAQLYNVDWDYDSKVLGYMFANDADLARYMEPAFLSSAIDKAYKLLFMAYTSTKLLVPENRQQLGKITYTAQAVVVEQKIARVLETLLALVAFLLISFLISSTRRPSGLIYDPSSFAGTMAMVANEPALLETFDRLDGTSSSKELKDALSGHHYKLSARNSGYQITINGQPSLQTKSREQGDKIDEEKHFELGTVAGIIFILVLVVLLIFLLFIYFKSLYRNGLPAFQDNLALSQLLYQYIPTAIATFLEPFWVLLTRFICVFQPIETLRGGNAEPSQSLTLKFESKPPAFMTFTAFKSGHYFLAILAATAFSTNALAIAFGALFQEISVKDIHQIEVRQLYQPIVESIPQSYGQPLVIEDEILPNHFPVGRLDHYYSIYANLTSNTSLPIWSTQSHFFLPFSRAENGSLGFSYTLKSQTIGMNASLECESADIKFSFLNPEILGEDPYVDAEFETPAFGTFGPDCRIKKMIHTETYQRWNYASVNYTGPIAMEAYPVLTSTSNDGRANETCGGIFTATFMRINRVNGFNGTKPQVDRNSVKSKSIICRPKINVAYYDVTVDASNQVVEFIWKNGISGGIEALFSHSATQAEFLNSIHLLSQPEISIAPNAPVLVFGHDNLPTEWMDFLLTTILKSPDLLKASNPLPDMKTVGYALSRAYSMVFAVVLGQYHEHIFAKQLVAVQSQGSLMTSDTRVEISKDMLLLAALLLGWYVMMAVYFYFFKVSHLFQRLPTSLASEIQLFHSSTALDDVRGTEFFTSAQRSSHLRGLGRKYGYGRFVARDGILRVGIEREPLLDHISDEEARSQGLSRIGVRVETIFRRGLNSVFKSHAQP